MVCRCLHVVVRNYYCTRLSHYGCPPNADVAGYSVQERISDVATLETSGRLTEVDEAIALDLHIVRIVAVRLDRPPRATCS